MTAVECGTGDRLEVGEGRLVVVEQRDNRVWYALHRVLRVH